MAAVAKERASDSQRRFADGAARETTVLTRCRWADGRARPPERVSALCLSSEVLVPLVRPGHARLRRELRAPVKRARSTQSAKWSSVLAPDPPHQL